MKSLLIIFLVNLCLFAKAQEGCYYDDSLNVKIYTMPEEFPRDSSGESIHTSWTNYLFKRLSVPTEQEERQYKVQIFVILSSDGDILKVGAYNKREDEYTPLEKSIIKILKTMPRQIPAKFNGTPVYFRMLLPMHIDYYDYRE